MTRLGYPESAILGIGLVLLAWVLLYVIWRTAVLGAILLTGYLGGACGEACTGTTTGCARSGAVESRPDLEPDFRTYNNPMATKAVPNHEFTENESLLARKRSKS